MKGKVRAVFELRGNRTVLRLSPEKEKRPPRPTNVRVAALREKRLRAGLCRDCGKDPATEGSRCRICQHKENTRKLQKRRARPRKIVRDLGTPLKRRYDTVRPRTGLTKREREYVEYVDLLARKAEQDVIERLARRRQRRRRW